MSGFRCRRGRRRLRLAVKRMASSGLPSLALFEVALFVSSSPRPHSHRAQRHLLAVRCRDGCGGEGQGEGAESSAVPPPLPNPLPHPLAVTIARLSDLCRGKWMRARGQIVRIAQHQKAPRYDIPLGRFNGAARAAVHYRHPASYRGRQVRHASLAFPFLAFPESLE